MAVLMPIAGRVYDRIGPRWPAAIGLTIVAAATYLMHTLTLDTSREHVMWLLVLRGAGLGMAMMPIMTGVSRSSRWPRSTPPARSTTSCSESRGALGLAVLTAILTTQQAQQMAGRAALLPADTPTPHLGARPPRLGRGVRHLPADPAAGVRRSDRRPVPDRLRSQRPGRAGGAAAAIRTRSRDPGRLHHATTGARAAGIAQRRGAPPCPVCQRQLSPTRPVPQGELPTGLINPAVAQ